jgi:peptidoglycan/LPS O-acetylase OafA/YrhL
VVGGAAESALTLAPEANAAKANAAKASAPEASARRLGHRPVLDGLRGIAVLLVILDHTGVVRNGYIGVDLFFALSGFLITSLLYEEWERRARISLRGFYERRARRLLPALLLAIVMFFLLVSFVEPVPGWSPIAKALCSLLFVNNWIVGLGHSTVLSGISPTWSLAEEEQFYLLWPVVLVLLLRYKVPPLVVLGLLLASSVALVVAVDHIRQLIPHYSFYYSPLDRAAELLFGCAGAVVWHNRLMPSVADLPGLTLRVRTALVSHRQLIRGVLALVLITVFTWLLLFVRLDDEREIYLSAAALAVAVIVPLIDAPGSLPARVLSCRPLRFLGRVSYCLYLIHLLVRDAIQHYFPGQSVYFNFVTTLAASLVLATISWRLLESKVIAAGRARRTTAARAPRGARLELAG